MPAKFPKTPRAIEAGRARRVAAIDKRNVRIQWFLKEVNDVVAMTMRQRVSMATSYLKDRVVRNISRPVLKGKGPRGGRVVTDRSKAGEYPKVETSTLMKGIFSTVMQVRPGVFDGYVGTPHSYGLILETKMNRSFLVRSLNEELPVLKRILSGPIR